MIGNEQRKVHGYEITKECIGCRIYGWKTIVKLPGTSGITIHNISNSIAYSPWRDICIVNQSSR